MPDWRRIDRVPLLILHNAKSQTNAFCRDFEGMQNIGRRPCDY